jgi:hypothetical protein
MQNINTYIKAIEKNLNDLSLVDKSRIINEIHQEITNNPALMNDAPLVMANQKREAMGFTKFDPAKQTSVFRFMMKSFGVLMIAFILIIGLLVWKFTPLLRVDEENNRITILGGLIDIDAKAGKFKIGNDYHFSEPKYKNDFQAKFPVGKQDIIFEFESGKFKLTTSETNELVVNCKLATLPKPKMVSQTQSEIKVDFAGIKGSSCDLEVPENANISLVGDAASLTVNSPKFNLDALIDNGTVGIQPIREINYQYDLSVVNGITGNFDITQGAGTYKISVKMQNGSIIHLE